MDTPAGASAADDAVAAIVPDEKDWTWTLERACPDCGFEAFGVERERIADLIRESAHPWPPVLGDPRAVVRPSPAVWSPLEYACHVRDVHRLFAQRARLMLEQDDPAFANWDQDETAVAERYGQQDPQTVAGELRDAAEQHAALFDGVTGDQWERTGVRSDGSRFTVRTLGQYGLHDLVHHLHDVGAR